MRRDLTLALYKSFSYLLKILLVCVRVCVLRPLTFYCHCFYCSWFSFNRPMFLQLLRVKPYCEGRAFWSCYSRYFTGRMCFLLPNKQRWSTKGERFWQFTDVHCLLHDSVLMCSEKSTGSKIVRNTTLQDAGSSNGKWLVWGDEMEGGGQDTMGKGS